MCPDPFYPYFGNETKPVEIRHPSGTARCATPTHFSSAYCTTFAPSSPRHPHFLSLISVLSRWMQCAIHCSTPLTSAPRELFTVGRSGGHSQRRELLFERDNLGLQVFALFELFFLLVSWSHLALVNLHWFVRAYVMRCQLATDSCLHFTLPHRCRQHTSTHADARTHLLSPSLSLSAAGTFC